MKVVINEWYGGFSLSKAAYEKLGIPWDMFGHGEMFDQKNRADPKLVEVVEELRSKANGIHARLKVVVIPDDVEWEIVEQDGMESVHEKHRSWE